MSCDSCEKQWVEKAYEPTKHPCAGCKVEAARETKEIGRAHV
jgi:hypothetical protein